MHDPSGVIGPSGPAAANPAADPPGLALPCPVMLQDFFFALRMVRNHPWFSAAVVVTLALGIGINTTVFTLVHSVLFKPVPIPGGERLVTVTHQSLKRPQDFPGLAHATFRELRDNATSFEQFEAMANAQAVISEPGNPPERYQMGRVTPGLLSMLRTPPELGRLLTPEDVRADGDTAIVIGHRIWQARYGGASDVIGRTVRLNGQPATIVGVMPENFRFPNNHDVWAPLSPKPADIENRGRRPLRGFALLKPGASIRVAAAELAGVNQRIAKEFPDTHADLGASVRTFHETFNGGPIRLVFLTMLGAVAFVLLIACANVANLMLSRALARARELSVRAALGASRPQLVRQLLVESVLLSCLGGLLGLGLAAGGVHLFDLATKDVGKPYWIQFEMDYVVFGYFAVISVLSGLLFGIAPALRASRVDLNTALKDGAQSGGSSRGRLTGALVVFQFALTVILLAGAGLMVRSFFAAQSVNAFLPADRLLTARINLPSSEGDRYHDRAARIRFHEDLQRRLAQLPDVTHAALAANVPGNGGSNESIEIEGRPLENPKEGLRVSTDGFSPGYPTAIGLPLLLGRDFEAADGEPGKEAAIATRTFAQRFWPGESALGRRFRFLRGEGKPGPWITIVGVTGDLESRDPESEDRPLVFTPIRQNASNWLVLLVRTAGDPAALAPLVRTAVQEQDQDLPLFDVRTMRQAIERQTWFLVVFGALFLSFALVALLMASIGLYAVVAQATLRRTREIGIRMALGATAGRVVQLVLGRGLLQLAVGLVLGLGGAFAATRLMKDMLVKTSVQDPVVFATVPLLLFLVGVLACLIPARRAAALHPVTALRQE